MNGERPVDEDALAASVTAAVEGPLMVGTTELSVTASVGTAVAKGDGLSPSELLHEDALAMYAVKRSRTAPDA